MAESYIGLDMTLYRNTGTYGSPVWDLIDNVRDLRIPRKMGEADVSTRRTKVKQFEPSQLELGVEWEMVKEEADLDYAAIQTAFNGRSMVELAFANGPIALAGTKFTRCEMKIFDFSEDQPLADADLVSVVAKPCRSINPPTTTTAA